MNILLRVVKGLKSEVRAFTLLDSLLTLFITSFVVASLTISLNHVFKQVEETLFFMDFERMYLETQTLAATKGQEISLQLTEQSVTNGYQELVLPSTVSFQGSQTLVFDREGGNSSLAKLVFRTNDKDVRYQIYLGSGKYKKTESQGNNTP